MSFPVTYPLSLSCLFFLISTPPLFILSFSQVRWDAKQDFEYVQNYKVLQDCFNKVGIAKKIPVQLLIRGKYQDNLEFMQWMKRFFELNHSGDAYSAVERRLKGKGAKGFKGNGKAAKKTTSRDKRDQFNAAAGTTTIRRPAAATGTTGRVPKASRDEESGREEKENRRSSNRTSRSGRTAGTTTTTTTMASQRRRAAAAAAGSGGSGASSAEVSTLRSKVAAMSSENVELQKKCAGFQLTVDGLEKERDFYFGKLRDIEILMQGVEEEGEENDDVQPAEQLKLLIERGLKILYATESEDFVAVTELVDAAEPELPSKLAETDVVVPPMLTVEEEEEVVEEEEEEEFGGKVEEEEEEEQKAVVTEGKEGGNVETF